PTVDPYAVVAGDALDRLTWRHDRPAFRGDRPGSLSALYDATLPAGLFGFALPVPYTQDDTFTAAAVFVID
ncbi:MAG: hypothetical protein GWN07_11055, partial [Actinobacteria bacterium]|nr:hypothetical protein [Actinomycetota bacterium]NIU66027.1 hypothetical protein [Actinomycetota bacterium]NIW27835.1 hypothetical protein [Actinomycetota bacterium]NIX20336.1 hypothetical protein [Actinomycetota bacterium]